MSGRGSNRGRGRATRSSQRAAPAPTSSAPITTRFSQRRNFAIPSTGATSASAEHAPLHLPDPQSPADSDIYGNPNSSATLTLAYLVVDNEFNPLGEIFTVKALPSNLVSDVMTSITATSGALDNIKASSVRLWKPLVPLPWPIDVDEGGTSPLNQLLVALRSNPRSAAQKLFSPFPISTYFDVETLLIVQAPISSDSEITGAKKRKRNSAGNVASTLATR